MKGIRGQAGETMASVIGHDRLNDSVLQDGRFGCVPGFKQVAGGSLWRDSRVFGLPLIKIQVKMAQGRQAGRRWAVWPATKSNIFAKLRFSGAGRA